MTQASSDALARTSATFDSWRDSQTGRRRIPDHLWQMAVALLDDYPLTRVAHELHLDPAQLRKRRHASSQPRMPNSSPAAQFIEVGASGLSYRDGSELKTDATPHQFTATVLRLVIERADGNRFTLSLPASEWPHVEALYSLFLVT